MFFVDDLRFLRTSLAPDIQTKRLKIKTMNDLRLITIAETNKTAHDVSKLLRVPIRERMYTDKLTLKSHLMFVLAAHHCVEETKAASKSRAVISINWDSLDNGYRWLVSKARQGKQEELWLRSIINLKLFFYVHEDEALRVQKNELCLIQQIFTTWNFGRVRTSSRLLSEQLNRNYSTLLRRPGKS